MNNPQQNNQLNQHLDQEALRIALETARLNQDVDGDGLSTRQERMMGLNPYDGDTDGDKKLDGEEIIQRSEPGRDEYNRSKKEQLKQDYYEIAKGMAGPEQENWQDLYEAIQGDQAIGRNLDWMVFNQSLVRGNSLEQSAELLTQSPFLQWHYHHGNMNYEQMADYANNIISEYSQPQRFLRRNEEEILEG